jgi:FtsZ-binding cell division protein ZapB
MNHKDTLKVIALKERIAELTAGYEDKIADVRADFTLAVEELQGRIDNLEKENQPLKDINAGYLERLEGNVVAKED